jgi:hypothetical protein
VSWVFFGYRVQRKIWHRKVQKTQRNPKFHQIRKLCVHGNAVIAGLRYLPLYRRPRASRYPRRHVATGELATGGASVPSDLHIQTSNRIKNYLSRADLLHLAFPEHPVLQNIIPTLAGLNHQSRASTGTMGAMFEGLLRVTRVTPKPRFWLHSYAQRIGIPITHVNPSKR